MSIKSHITDDDILAARQLLTVACHLEPWPQMLLPELEWLRLKAAREDWDVDAVDAIALIRGGATDAEQHDGAMFWLVEQAKNGKPVCKGFARRIIDRIGDRMDIDLHPPLTERELQLAEQAQEKVQRGELPTLAEQLRGRRDG